MATWVPTVPMSLLPITTTTSDFPEIRQHNLLYVDKTAHLAAFLSHPDKAHLFTRPRRFGKSLMLSTIAALYRGNRELFRGDDHRPELAVCREGTWPWCRHPVLRLDMLTVRDRGQGIGPALANMVHGVALEMGLQDQIYFQPYDAVSSLSNLIRVLRQQAQARVIILVDEYDAPILNHMHEPQGVQVREHLADFYGVFKSMDHQIEKLVLTGVTRFVKTGLWSKLNQVRDQTQNPQYHDLIGFTDAELDVLWHQAAYPVPQAPLGTDRVPLSRTAWQEWYNGYRFAPQAAEAIYNPYAILRSLQEGEIAEYWSASGHLGVVEALLQAPWTEMLPRDRVPLYLTRPQPAPPYELRFDWLDQLNPGRTPEEVLLQWQPHQMIPLLYQTGYLTLTTTQALAPPNREIATYLSQVLLQPWLETDNRQRALAYQERLIAALQRLDMPDMVANLNALLPLLPLTSVFFLSHRT